MPNTASAKKRLQQNIKRRARNRAAKSTIRTHIKKIIGLVSAGDTAAAEQAYRVAAKLLDRAGAKNIIHRNAAARQKSRLQRLIKSTKQPQEAGTGTA
jgi:small subunit ribosomal protein S20